MGLADAHPRVTERYAAHKERVQHLMAECDLGRAHSEALCGEQSVENILRICVGFFYRGRLFHLLRAVRRQTDAARAGLPRPRRTDSPSKRLMLSLIFIRLFAARIPAQRTSLPISFGTFKGTRQADR